MNIQSIAAASLALVVATTAEAQVVPPKELQVPRIFCNQNFADGAAFINQLAPGGKWERIDAKRFVYATSPVNPVTNRREDWRFMFVRQDAEMYCGDVTPCAHMTHASKNGYEFRNYQFESLCSLVLLNAKTASAVQGLEKNPAAMASVTGGGPTSDTKLETTAGTLRIEGSLVLLGGRELFIDMQSLDVTIREGWPANGPARYALLTLNSGGTACPAQYRLVDAASRKATDPFGNCSDLPKTSFDGEAVRIDFPAFRSAEAESYQYTGGKLKKVQ